MRELMTTCEIAEHLGISRREWTKFTLEACTGERFDRVTDAETLGEIMEARASIIAGESGKKGEYWRG